MDEFCKKANITGYAKMALDAFNKTVVDQTANAKTAAVEAFKYDPATNKDAVI